MSEQEGHEFDGAGEKWRRTEDILGAVKADPDIEAETGNDPYGIHRRRNEQEIRSRAEKLAQEKATVVGVTRLESREAVEDYWFNVDWLYEYRTDELVKKHGVDIFAGCSTSGHRCRIRYGGQTVESPEYFLSPDVRDRNLRIPEVAEQYEKFSSMLESMPEDAREAVMDFYEWWYQFGKYSGLTGVTLDACTRNSAFGGPSGRVHYADVLGVHDAREEGRRVLGTEFPTRKSGVENWELSGMGGRIFVWATVDESAVSEDRDTEERENS